MTESDETVNTGQIVLGQRRNVIIWSLLIKDWSLHSSLSSALLSVSLVSTSRGQEEDNGAPDQWDSVSQADVSSPDNNVSSLQHHATFNTRDSTLISSFIVCPPHTPVENTGGRRENFVKPFLLTCYFSREVLSCFLWLVLKIDVIAITRSLSFVQNIFRET